VARASRVSKVVEKTAAAVQAIKEKAGQDCQVVTGGGSGTYRVEAGSGVFTEVQPGEYTCQSLAGAWVSLVCLLELGLVGGIHAGPGTW
jgi:D-serine deaminase-like pyridoxal phosphate-dependent protein